MKNIRKKNLAFFFTSGVSLEAWNDAGIITREAKPYLKMSDYFGKIYFFTYGEKADLSFQIMLGGIEILIKKNNFSDFIYSLIVPLLYRDQLKSADIIKTNQMNGAWAGVFAKILYRKRLVVRCGYEWLIFFEKNSSNYLKNKIVYCLEKFCYKNADKIILTSEKDKQFVRDRFGINSEKIEVIPNYIDTDLFKPLDLSRSKKRIIFAGRLENQKNLFNLIEAIKDLDVELVIIGKGSLEDELRTFSKNSKAKIEFKGNIPNDKLPYELNCSEIFILPSLYEGCPKTLLEAMSCGLPCIGSDVEGIREVIKHKENGYLCNTDAESIREAIIEVSGDKNLQHKLGLNARKTIEEKFSLDKILEKEMRIYEAL
jgi:glycosyltransferase involved in cell wall biosynthesis